jgi:hypothetical protein
MMASFRWALGARLNLDTGMRVSPDKGEIVRPVRITTDKVVEIAFLSYQDNVPSIAGLNYKRLGISVSDACGFTVDAAIGCIADAHSGFEKN